MAAVPFFVVIPCCAQKQDSLQNAIKNGIVLKKDIVVLGNTHWQDAQMKSSQSLVHLDRAYLDAHFGASLTQTLDEVPGVKAMAIGSGQSKPAIRGLGFNRMVVAADGIKYEGQQWGEDHGLEVDQYAVDNVEVIKGPGALRYGSDAIGGVLSLTENAAPWKNFGGRVSLFGRSNNESLGASVRLEGRKGKFFYKIGTTWIDYADYRVPTDSIQYYSYYIKLKNRRLRNTAGREHDADLTLGYQGDRFRTTFRVSDNYSRSGFFANAHGLEVRLSEIDYDKSRRDIDLPYHWSNHLWVANQSMWKLGDGMWLEGNFAYQHNLQEEQSEPISHGYMPTPKGTLERKFNKQTGTANVALKMRLGDKHNFSTGVDTEYQRNRIGGWGFIIPSFHTMSAGVYAIDHFYLSESLMINAGVRFDYINTHIGSYSDWYKTPVSATDSVFKERSSVLDRSFTSLTWSAGVAYTTGGWVLKANIGKSFRAPIAKELGADGVNYHIFRYEKGNRHLSPEESYQLDAGIGWRNNQWKVQFDPYINFFPNYIYLNPSANYEEGLQVYRYSQSRVWRYGFEAEAAWRFLPYLEAGVQGEYLYARQLSGEKKGYTLPLTPPWTADLSLKYLFLPSDEDRSGFFSLAFRFTARQNEIVPPEKATPAHGVLNASAGKTFGWNGRRFTVGLQAQNLLGKKYYDHTSYYRLIDVPEPGRNFSLMLGLIF